MEERWATKIVVEIKQLRAGARVWLDVSISNSLATGAIEKRQAYYDSSLLSRELCSSIDAMCRSFSITETVDAPM